MFARYRISGIRHVLVDNIKPFFFHLRIPKSCSASHHQWFPRHPPGRSFSSESYSASSPDHRLIAQQIQVANKKIARLTRTGRLAEARALFNGLKHRNTVTWNSMISGYVRSQDMLEARKLFDRMPQRDVVSWNVMISGCISCYGRKGLEEGRKLFDQMPERDFVSWNTMISGYAKGGRMEDALGVFESMPEKNVVSWNAIVSGFLQNGEVTRAMEFFERMPARDAASISGVVSGLIQNDDLDAAANVLFDYGVQGGMSGEELVCAYNTLIAGCGQKGRVAEARKLFDGIPCDDDSAGHGPGIRRNLVSWNSMIMCYVKVGDVGSARALFDQMKDRDLITWNTMITGYTQASNMEEASKLFALMPRPDILSWNSMISGYADSGKLKQAQDLFERIPEKNKVTWNSIIAGFEKNGDHEGAIKLFIRMQAKGEKADLHTLSSMVSVCAQSVALCLGMQIHQQVIKVAVPDIPLNNSLVTMYARCGAISEARTIFDEMKSLKDVISWNAMIAGYAHHGHEMKALELFESMKRQNVKPTHITFISVLSACTHAGLVDQGKMHFQAMVDEFGIDPRVEHYASLVDMVGRYGDLEEAVKIIRGMPVKADKAVWGALLGACKEHNNVELAQVAAEALWDLDVEDPSPYVTLSNMFVDAGRWDDANKVRMAMDYSKIKKHGGYSRLDAAG